MPYINIKDKYLEGVREELEILGVKILKDKRTIDLIEIALL